MGYSSATEGRRTPSQSNSPLEGAAVSTSEKEGNDQIKIHTYIHTYIQELTSSDRNFPDSVQILSTFS